MSRETSRATSIADVDEGEHLMYIGIGTLVVILLIIMIIYFVRRA
jgi:hypothetical protein